MLPSGLIHGAELSITAHLPVALYPQLPPPWLPSIAVTFSQILLGLKVLAASSTGDHNLTLPWNQAQPTPDELLSLGSYQPLLTQKEVQERKYKKDRCLSPPHVNCLTDFTTRQRQSNTIDNI